MVREDLLGAVRLTILESPGDRAYRARLDPFLIDLVAMGACPVAELLDKRPVSFQYPKIAVQYRYVAGNLIE